MNPLKPKKSNRKFYNKWFYKSTIGFHNAFVVRYKVPHKSMFKIDETILDRYLAFFQEKDPSTFARRVERNSIDFYTNDSDFFEEFNREFYDVLKCTWTPSEQLIKVGDEKHCITVNQLPHGKYNYKVYLAPHRVKDLEQKQQYVKWLSGQPNILISEKVKQWFIDTSWNWDRRYIYVEDEKALLLLKLRLSDAMGSVYTYKTADKY